MLRLAHWKISADLCKDQPLDACGYIAADAVCLLRNAALAEANSWRDPCAIAIFKIASGSRKQVHCKDG